MSTWIDPGARADNILHAPTNTLESEPDTRVGSKDNPNNGSFAIVPSQVRSRLSVLWSIYQIPSKIHSSKFRLWRSRKRLLQVLDVDIAEMNDPSSGVPPALVNPQCCTVQSSNEQVLIVEPQLPHIHLLSTYQYPVLHHVSIDTVVEYLLSAQRITRELAAMAWTYLDAPSDGSVLLVWQPLAQLGTNFASDGYVWADPETAFNSPVRGYVSAPEYVTPGTRFLTIALPPDC